MTCDPARAVLRFEQLVDPDHLEAAAARTLSGKGRRPDVAWFRFVREERLTAIRTALRTGAWRPGPVRLLFLRDPKPRVICRTSVDDRVVHTALAMLLEPWVLPSCSEADFACRRGCGTHRAILALLRLMRRHRFALHLDLRSYFPSIDLAVLRRQVARRVHDRRLRDLIDRILAAGRGSYDPPSVRRHARMDPDWPPPGRGLPMGSVVSQLLAAHVYLQDFDHRVKRLWKVPGYVRYVDDMFLFGDSRAALRGWRSAVGEYLGAELHLRLKHPQARVLSCRGHLDALGVRIRREVVEPLPAAWRRWRGRVGDYVRGRGGGRSGETGAPERLQRSLQASAGHLFFG